MFTFQFLNDKIVQNTNLAKLPVPNGFFGITVNFIIQKLKSKHFVCLSFLRWQFFFEGTRENILHIFRALKKCRRLSFLLHQHTTVRWKAGRNLNGCGFSHYHQAKDGKKLCSMGHNKHLPNDLLAFAWKLLWGFKFDVQNEILLKKLATLWRASRLCGFLDWEKAVEWNIQLIWAVLSTIADLSFHLLVLF